MKQLRAPLIILFIGFFSLSCQHDRSSNTTDSASTLQQTKDSAASLPNGTGKNSADIAEDYINTNRVIWQKPDLIIDLMGDLENKTIADIGAGTGFFAFRLVPRAKKVIAIDIDSRFVNYIDSIKVLELPENLQSKLEARLATPDNPNLRPGEADVILIVNTFMYIRNRAEYLKTLHKGMSNGAKLIIIDFKKKRTPIGPPSEMRLPIHEVEEALYAAGFQNITTNDTALDYQYFVMAEK